MSKKLLIAVLTLGLLFTFSGVVLGYDDPGNMDRIPMRTTNPDAPLVNQLTKIHTQSLQRPPDEQIGQANVTLLPPPYYCDYIDYSGGNFVYFIRIPAASGADLYNMRFNEASGYTCTLLTAWVAMYKEAFIGTPDLKVIVWDDDGYGLPGPERAFRIIPNASIPAGANYVAADFSTEVPQIVYEDGEKYFVGVTTGAPGTGQIAMLVDGGTAGTGRSNLWLPNATPPPAGYFYNRAANGMADYNFGIGIDICCGDIPYSSCYTQEYDCGPAYYFQNPNGYGVTYFNTRFSVEGPETLVDVGIAMYYGGSTGNPDLLVEVYGSNAGFPDLTDPKFSTTVLNANIIWFPNWTQVPVGQVMRDDFHLTWSPVGAGVLAGLMDDASCSSMRSSAYWDPDWYTMLDLFGEDNNWLMYADMCRDEFSVCTRIVNYCDPYYLYSMPHSGGNGRIGGFEKIEPFGIGCRLEEVRIATSDNGVAGKYQYTGTMMICPADINDNPDIANPLAVKTIGPGQPDPWVNYPGFNTWDVLSLNITFDQPLYIGLMTNKPGGTPPPDYYLVGDDDACGGDNAVIYKISGVFQRFTGSNFLIDAYVCCIPPPERTCVPGEDWPTSGHDFRRTAASNNSVGDAKCNQALAWAAFDAQGAIYSRPIIYDDVILAAYNNKLVAYDINVGPTPLWTITGLPYIGTGFRNTVTVKDGFVYFGGGNGRSFTKADVFTGVAVWSHNVLGPVVGDPLKQAPLTGNLTYAQSVILTCGATEVVYTVTDAGMLYAFDAATGAEFYPPVPLDGNPWATLSSNGSDVLYVGTGGEYGDGNGTLYAIDACTGVTLWSLRDTDLYGYDLQDADPPLEIFQGPIAVDVDGMIYVMTSVNGDQSAAPSGIYYKISPAGTIIWGVPGKFERYSGPILDANELYIVALRAWTSEEQRMEGLSKMSGGVVWQSSEEFLCMNWVEGALSCEPLASDLIFQPNMNSQLLVIKADDGVVDFEYNYVGSGSPRGSGAAIDPAHVAFTTRQGDLFVLSNFAKADRPRLRILKTSEFQTVPFFSPPSVPVTFEDVFMNNGCALLTGNLTASTTPSAAYAWTVNPQRINRLRSVADNMVNNSYSAMANRLVKNQRVDGSVLDAEFAESPYAKDNYSSEGAYAAPAWLNSITTPTISLGPGQVFDVVYDVNGPLVYRGPQRCYVTIATNDQYFLNSTASPVVQLGVLGGCMQSDDALVFGTTEQNAIPVFSTGELGNQIGAQQWTFDGENNRYWQGGYFYAADVHRLAWTTESWHGADPDNFFNSLLPDPNCFNQCEPYVTPDPIRLGGIWNGSGYDDVEGYAAHAAYIDSVINFGCHGSWSWQSGYDCPFDNALTIGLRIEQFTYGAIGVADLNNVVIYRHDITNRNIAPITAYMGAFNDFDLSATVNGFDLFRFDAAYSIAWGSPCTPAYDFTDGVVYGTGLIPMDLPMIGSRTIDANQAMWHAADVALDSMYIWMTTQPGQTAQAGIDMNFPCDEASESDDRDEWASYFGHTFAGHETYSVGTYYFGYAAADVTDDQFWFDLAIRVNQFAGFARGDINSDGVINLADGVALWNVVNNGGAGPLFENMADVNGDGSVNIADVNYLYNFCFCVGPAPYKGWALPNICP